MKIVTSSIPPSQWKPWKRYGPHLVSGSGVVIHGNRILTAAHVVADHAMIEVQRADTGGRYTAKVEHVCHVCDLALLAVSDPEFFRGTQPMQIGKLPSLQQAVEIHGFPKGGEGLSITTGVVSRIGFDVYSHSQSKLLLVQVDAAINAGNSGGPAISDGKVVGVAMQMIKEAENIGYIVPPPVIQHFLEDVEDGRFDGFPQLDIQIQGLANPSLRHKLGLPKHSGGVLVTAVRIGSPAHEVLRAGDVLLEIDGVPIGDDNMVALKDGIRVNATVLEHRSHVGDTLNVTILREGKKLRVPILMKVPSPLVPSGEYDRDLSYRAFGGLVFQSLTRRYVNEWKKPPSNLSEFLRNPGWGGYSTLVPGQRVDGRREVVLISSVLRTKLTRGYEDYEDEVVFAVNGERVRDLRHLSDLLDTSTGDFVTILLERGNLIVLNRAEADLASFLERYEIPSDRSLGLQVPANSAD